MAASILVVILGSLGSLLVSSSRAYETNRQVTASSGQLRAALDALEYDISLAGYCGVAGSACELSDPLVIQYSETNGVRLVTRLDVAYTENRYVDAPAVQRVTYEVAEGKLFRRVGEDTPSTVAEGVVNLVLLGFRSQADTTPQLRFNLPEEGNLAGLDLRLEYQRGQDHMNEDLTISLRNRL